MQLLGKGEGGGPRRTISSGGRGGLTMMAEVGAMEVECQMR